MRWAKWFGKHAFRRVPRLSYPLACGRFIRGFCETANIDISSNLLLPTTKSVCCVLTVKNEAATLRAQLNELRRLPFEEIIVVVNGSTDNSYEVARNHPVQATVVHFDSALGYDVGRAVGARMSHSDMILFLDGDMTIRVDLLLPFIYEIEKGADVVLNPISSLLPTFERRDSVSNIKQFFKYMFGKAGFACGFANRRPPCAFTTCDRKAGNQRTGCPSCCAGEGRSFRTVRCPFAGYGRCDYPQPAP